MTIAVVSLRGSRAQGAQRRNRQCHCRCRHFGRARGHQGGSPSPPRGQPWIDKPTAFAARKVPRRDGCPGSTAAGLPRPPDHRAGRRRQHVEFLSPRPAPLLRASCRTAESHDLAKVGEDDVSEFLVALRRGTRDSASCAVRGVGRAGADRGARFASVRRGRGLGRTRRGAGRAAADARAPATQEPDDRRGAGTARGRRRRQPGRRPADAA